MMETLKASLWTVEYLEAFIIIIFFWRWWEKFPSFYSWRRRQNNLWWVLIPKKKSLFPSFSFITSTTTTAEKKKKPHVQKFPFNNKPWVRTCVLVMKRNFPNFPAKYFPIRFLISILAKKKFFVYLCAFHIIFCSISQIEQLTREGKVTRKILRKKKNLKDFPHTQKNGR